MELTEYCKAQYAACMDNYCNVLDENQGRCSCCSNLKNYEQMETNLRTANSELQKIAQDIRYIGLSADEITTLFTQTEAELKMAGTTDTSNIKSNLDEIRDLILSANTTTTTTSSGNNMGLDISGLMNFSIDSTGFDLGSLLGTTTNTSINNQRGDALYKTAAARCKTSVLNSCVAQGVNATIVTNSYDLEIDKQCIAYERSLNEANSQMTATLNNAENVLKQARLLVARQKNEYTFKECVTELDKCMQDEFVCGTDYQGCLDPSGKYIVNGSLIIGSEPGSAGDTSKGLYTTVWSPGSSSNSPWTDDGSISKYVSNTLKSYQPTTTHSNDIATFLLNKIGYQTDNKTHGMCMYVLNKCQEYTYTGGTINNRVYATNNAVVSDYLQRTLAIIKAAQDEVLSDHAEKCMTDVQSCLNKNNIRADNCTLAANACSNIIKSCKSVSNITGDDNAIIKAATGIVCNPSVGGVNNSLKSICYATMDQCLRTKTLTKESDCTAAINSCKGASNFTECKKLSSADDYNITWIQTQINKSYCAKASN